MDIMSIINAISWIISISAGVTSVLPNKNEKAKRGYNVVRSILDVLAFNFGHAKNKE